MSYGGYEYTERSYNTGGFDPMAGFSNYDNGAVGSGGFMGDEKGKGSDKKPARDRQSLIPLSIKQLNSASHEDDTFRVDNAELSVVKLVGIVDNLVEHETNLTFRLSDGSGSIECRQWIEKGGAVSKTSKIQNNCMMKVIGNVKAYDNKTHVLVYDASVVTDFNELTYHLLDVILVHCQQTKGPIPGSVAVMAGGGGFGTPSRGGVGAFASSGGGFGHSGVNLGSGVKAEAANSMTDTVYSAYLGLGSDSGGLHYQTVIEKLVKRGVSITMEQLMRVVAQLCDDGRLYSTIDENHYRPTGDEY